MSTLIVEASLLHMTRRPVPATRLVELFKVPTLTGLYFCICFCSILNGFKQALFFCFYTDGWVHGLADFAWT
jgi:hypothetical protein